VQPTDVVTNEEELGEKLPQPEPEARPRKRKRLRISFLIAGIAILGAIIYLVVSNTQANAVYYMTVSELKSCKTCLTQDVRVAGVVQAGSIVRNDERQTISFVITEGSQKLPVTYTGVVPDIFAPGITVVVEGNYTGSGPFQAQTLLAKCPSKFQTATPTP
jgi:cytochrome c-type biogenesis protein CcmE